MTHTGRFDGAVVGAGHAGFEAAMAMARLGLRVAVFALHIDSVGNMPCNPAIGGTAKGQIVREIDALGGKMGKAADATALQIRLLNRGKGPAVRSPRSQNDRRAYSAYVRRTLENHPNISLFQREITDFQPGADGLILADSLGSRYRVKCAVIASGTYLRGKVITGDRESAGGPDGLTAADSLSEPMKILGLRRFKTGTPPRLDRRTIDLSRLETQPGETDAAWFSFETSGELPIGHNCWLAWTNGRTHAVLRENLSRSPLYNGAIEGIGPRYCPSIEDKITRFADKSRHPLFLEPMGADTSEVYLQGFSSSMPFDVQLAAVRTVDGFENAEITRPAYAIEYDCLDPLTLKASLETKSVPGLFTAGQINGTSGYEEAAAQGLIAGINAARYAQGKEPIVLTRASSYIGTLIDDLVTRGTNEPYRMMTSRSEYRMLLRHDNADRRLTKIGYDIGLISEERYARFLAYEERVAAGDTSDPRAKYQLEIEKLYSGYIARQERLWARVQRQENKPIPRGIDYFAVPGLSFEAAQKLTAQTPERLGQCSRISGVSPADLTALMLYTERGSL